MWGPTRKRGPWMSAVAGRVRRPWLHPTCVFAPAMGTNAGIGAMENGFLAVPLTGLDTDASDRLIGRVLVECGATVQRRWLIISWIPGR